MRLLLAAVFLVAAGAGCSDEPAVLSVDLRTDLAYGTEFVSVRTELRSTPPVTEEWTAAQFQETSARLASADLIAGARVAEFEDSSAGRQWARVTLFDASGDPVGARVVSFDAPEGNYGLVVVVTRSCRSVDCSGTPDTPECYAGRCVPTGCRPESPETCGSASCVLSSDCTTDIACAEVTCEGGACFETLRDSLCDSGSVCTVDGCTSGAGDSGPADAATDAGADADGGDADAGGDGGVDSDLILWLECDDDPSDGVTDSSSFGRDGTLLGPPPTVVPGHIGMAYVFGGVHALRIPNDDGLFDTTVELTITAWVRPRAFTDIRTIVAKPRNLGTLDSYLLFFDWAELSYRMDTLLTYGEPLSAIGAVVEEWNHVAVSYAGGVARLYLDGTMVAMGPFTNSFDDGPVIIGADLDDGMLGAQFRGDLDEIRIYRRTLSDTEIAALAAE